MNIIFRANQIKILQAETDEHYRQAKLLFRQYASTLDFDLGFQGFEDEVTTLPGVYSPPDGCILLAVDIDRFVGCVALRKLENNICEMKRLFVIPEYRAKKVGRLLANKVVALAGKSGYKTMRLDTVAEMKEANRLYQSLGFQQIEAYCYNPLEKAAYYELHMQ